MYIVPLFKLPQVLNRKRIIYIQLPIEASNVNSTTHIYSIPLGKKSADWVLFLKMSWNY